ncbi:hypothetical protein [Acinetobacter nosocomialis]|nr:hypothetical protein [Acinetobacter nosocomialis]
MKQQRYISILDTFSWNKLQIDVADIFHILKLKKTTMIASYEEGVIGVEQAKHLLDELEKLQYLWCLVEQNVSLTLDQFKHNLMHSTATNWVLIRQEIASLSCDQNLRFFPYLKIGNELYLVWLILKTLMQSPSSNDYQPYLYLPLNTNVT